MDTEMTYTLNILSFDFLSKTYYIEEHVATLFTIPESTDIFTKCDGYIYNYADSIEACNYSDFFTDTRGEYRFTLKKGEKVTKELIEEFLAKLKEESCKRLTYSLNNLRKQLYEVGITSLNLKEWELED